MTYILICIIIVLIVAIIIQRYNFIEDKVFIRKDAIEQSKNVIRGQINEELAPLFPDFPYSLKDCKFFGQPIDYVVIGDDEIIFAEVKTNKSRESKKQKRIKELINQGKVRFEVWRIENQQLKIK